MGRITHERWIQAQEAELKEYWDHRPEVSFDGFSKVFMLLGVDPKVDFKDKTIVEVAAGSVPAVMMVEGAKRRVAVEPLMATELWKPQRVACEATGVEIVADAYEYVDIDPSVGVDETWLFNAMEHVIDPVEQMKKAMETSQVVRVFEATNGLPPSTAHPHTITKELITSVMGDFGEVYIGGTIKENFHQSDCYYGTWTRNV
jgi:hypothetical protein